MAFETVPWEREMRDVGLNERGPNSLICRSSRGIQARCPVNSCGMTIPVLAGQVFSPGQATKMPDRTDEGHQSRRAAAVRRRALSSSRAKSSLRWLAQIKLKPPSPLDRGIDLAPK